MMRLCCVVSLSQPSGAGGEDKIPEQEQDNYTEGIQEIKDNTEE